MLRTKRSWWRAQLPRSFWKGSSTRISLRILPLRMRVSTICPAHVINVSRCLLAIGSSSAISPWVSSPSLTNPADGRHSRCGVTLWYTIL